MPVSENLALEIFTIVIFHAVALLLLFGFTSYIILRAKKTALLYSYIFLVSMIMIWILSKILKTVAPTEDLRWVFIVTQYFGVAFIGLAIMLFAYLYTKDRLPSRRILFLWSVFPVASFLIVLTNPIHMSFYSYYDFSKDSFGYLFYPMQIIQYLYLITGITLLSKGYTNQPSFLGKKAWSRFFALFTLLPLLSNAYYILYKLDLLAWVFPFPVFDFTPIAGSIALILFMMPALKYRFFDISPISYAQIFEGLPNGLIFLNKRNMLYAGNHGFYSMFNQENKSRALGEFLALLPFQVPTDIQRFWDFIQTDDDACSFEIFLKNDKVYKVKKKALNSKTLLLNFTDISMISANQKRLIKQNNELHQTNIKLDSLAQDARDLAIARTKADMAQNMHDILGHSLSVVIGVAELAAEDENQDTFNHKLSQMKNLLKSSLEDLKNAFLGKETQWGETSLAAAISQLENQNIKMDLISQGIAYELDNLQTEALFRLCQESMTNAIKHGRAASIHIVLRYKPQEIEVFAIDNGKGCQVIKKSYGLLGIESRIQKLGGRVLFGSDGKQGFTVHAILPKSHPEENVK
ncbi:MAG: hypothetical protein EOM59_10570 [Clostridia bacterium]|nr:hypothetical protein [Clostridia bacterium]